MGYTLPQYKGEPDIAFPVLEREFFPAFKPFSGGNPTFNQSPTRSTEKFFCLTRHSDAD